MSVLRRAKLRTPDGIESIEYPLGVDAENVEVANRENLSQRLVRIDEDLEKNEEDIAAVSELAGRNRQNIGANEIRIDALERRSASVDKKPYYFNTVADMKAYQELKAGDMAITLGYYDANDSGGALYKIREKTNDDVIDNMFIISVNNNNTVIAELITDNNTNIKQLGAKGNEIDDDTQILQNAINKLNSVVIPDGIFLIDTVTINKQIEIKGNGDNSKILKKISSNPNLIIISQTDYVSIHDIMLQGDQNSNTENNAIYINTRTSWGGKHYLFNLRIFFFNGYGIFIGERNQGLDITNNRIHYTAKEGIYGTNIADNKISDCFISYSKRYGVYYHGSNSIISNLRLNDCNRDDLEDYGGIYVWKQNILQNIMLQQNKVKDILINGDNNKIDYIANMCQSNNYIPISCILNGNNNDISINVKNGASGDWCGYILDSSNDIYGNNVNVNYSNETTSPNNSNATKILKKYFHPSNRIIYNSNNVNKYVNVFDESKIAGIISSSPTQQTQLVKNNLNEFIYDSGIVDIDTSTGIIIQVNINGLTNSNKINVDFDFFSNLPVNGTYAYRATIVARDGHVFSPVDSPNYTRSKGHISNTFEVDTVNYEINLLRIRLYKLNSDYTHTGENIKLGIENLIISDVISNIL